MQNLKITYHHLTKCICKLLFDNFICEFLFYFVASLSNCRKKLKVSKLFKTKIQKLKERTIKHISVVWCTQRKKVETHFKQKEKFSNDKD